MTLVNQFKRFGRLKSTLPATSYGYKHKAVCLCDYRNIDINSNFYDDISEYIKRKHIFILKENEYKNIIPPKTEEEYNNSKDEGWLIPYFECWYKGILPLNKIKKIYCINVYNAPLIQKISKEAIKYLDL